VLKAFFFLSIESVQNQPPIFSTLPLALQDPVEFNAADHFQ